MAGNALTIDVHWNGARVTHTGIGGRTLPPIERMLAGRTAAEALRIVPLLYGLCGRAQVVAAVTAYEAAHDREADPATRSMRELQVLGEAFYEHCWRALLAWPELFGLTAAPEPMKEVNATLRNAGADDWPDVATGLEDIVATQVLGMPSSVWLQADDAQTWWTLAGEAGTVTGAMVRALADGDGAWGQSDVALLPALDAHTARETLAPMMVADDDFCARPRWHGQPRETGPLARLSQHPAIAKLMQCEGNSVRVRQLTRITELAAIPRYIEAVAAGATQGWVQAAHIGDGAGLAWVETARGRLMHFVQLDGERIERYRIVAPTEWNFADDGACGRALTGSEATDKETLRRRAELLVSAIDPCVACKVKVHHA